MYNSPAHASTPVSQRRHTLDHRTPAQGRCFKQLPSGAMAADASAEASAAALLDDESDEEADTQLEQEGGGDGQGAVEAGDVVVEGAGEEAEADVVVEQAVVPAAADDAPTDGAAEPAPAGEGISATSPYVGVVRLHGLLAGTTNKDIVEFLAVEGGVSLVSESDVVFQLEQRCVPFEVPTLPARQYGSRPPHASQGSCLGGASQRWGHRGCSEAAQGAHGLTLDCRGES